MLLRAPKLHDDRETSQATVTSVFSQCSLKIAKCTYRLLNYTIVKPLDYYAPALWSNYRKISVGRNAEDVRVEAPNGVDVGGVSSSTQEERSGEGATPPPQNFFFILEKMVQFGVFWWLLQAVL